MINDDQNKTTSLSLEQIREDIDSVDQQIQELLNRRASLAEAVAKLNLLPKRILCFIVLNVKHKFYAKSWSATKVLCLMSPWRVCSVKLCLLCLL